MLTLAKIEELTKRYSEAHRQLHDAVSVLEDEIHKLKRAHLPRIRRLVVQAATARTTLHAAVEAAPELFQRPRTLVMHGVKVGYAKGKGRLEFEDAQQVVRLIRKHMPNKFDELVKVTETPVRSALNQLPVADLRRIGVTVVEAGDEVVIKPTDGDVDRLIEALLKDAAEQEAA